MKNERITYTGSVELRNDKEKGENKIVGYAAKFGVMSEDLGGFREVLERGFFDDVLEDDTLALMNHDSSLILGRKSNGTLRLVVDDIGLRYEIDVPNTTVGRDTLEYVRRRDIIGSSFGFQFAENGYKIERMEDGTLLQKGIKASRLFDVGPVTFPAYQASEATARSMQEKREITSKDFTNQKLKNQGRRLPLPIINKL